MRNAIEEHEAKGQAARAASRSYLSTEIKNRALLNVAESLIGRQEEILAANKIDYEESKSAGMDEVMLDH